MKLKLTFFLKSLVIIVGLIVLAICIFILPNIIGFIELGGYDPILLGIYISTIPFFIAMYQTIKLLNYIDKGRIFSDLSVKTLRIIRYCAISISVLYIIGMPYIFRVADQDDAPGLVAIGLIFAFVPMVVVVITMIIQNILQDVIKNYVKKI